MIDYMLIDKIIKDALNEDMTWGDVTTDSTIPDDTLSKGNFILKQDGILSGIDTCKRVFEIYDTTISFEKFANDGDALKKGDIVASVFGNAKNVLKCERVALNLLQRMSGIATYTAQFVQSIKGTNAKIVDTRKTVPNLRILDKYSVRMGGGYNHRYNLSDMVLIKDNHIKACGGIKKATETVKSKLSHSTKIEVEVESVEELKEALDAGVDIIMLDNMSLDMMRECVSIAKGKVLLEASGNVNLETVSDIAKTGVDLISVGAITHSVSALDISLRFL